jgi:hypothetical protein
MMNGNGSNLDSRIAAQAERLAKKPEPQPQDQQPHATAGLAAPVPPVAQTLTEIAEVRAVLYSNGTAQITLPDQKQHFLALYSALVDAALNRAAQTAYEQGATEAANAVAKNPRLGPLMWLRQRFKKAPASLKAV